MRNKTRQRGQAASGVTATASQTIRSPLRGDDRERKVPKSEKLSSGVAKIRKREGLRRASEGLKNSEGRIIHLNSVLRAIRNINQLIVHEKDRARLIRKSCRLLVEARGYTNVWILLVDKDKNFVSAASAGAEEQLSFFVGGLKRGEYPQCVHQLLEQEQSLAIYDDVSSQCKGCSLAGSRSHRSAFMGRLEYEGKVYGIMAVHILPELTSDKDEQGLFRELTGDIAYALASIEREEERERLHKELQSSEEQYRDLFDSTSDLIQSVAPDGRLLYTNKAWREALGYSEEEIANLKIWDIISPESMDHCMELFKRVMSGEHVRDIEAVFVAKDGSPIAVEGDSHCRFVKGKPVSTQGFFRDVTERKRAEEALRQSEERYRTLFNSELDGICVMDETMKVLLVNQAAVDIFGFDSIDEALGANPFDFIPPEERERVLDIVKKDMFESDLRQVNEFRLTNKLGKDIWVSAIGTLTEYQGKLAGLISFRDITERKRAEEALQENENRLQTIFSTIQVGVLIISADTHEIVDANQRAIELIGATKEEIVGSVCHNFVCPAEKGRCPITDLGQAVDNSERVLINAGGESIPIIKSVKTMIIGGQEYLIESFLDITELKRAEEALANEATRRRILFDQSRDGIVVLDEDAKVVEANQRFAEMLGYSPEEVRELHTWDWDTQWTREELLEMGQGVDEAGIHVETYHRRRDGTVFDVDISINGVMFAGQKLIFCVCRDITDRKKAEEELRQSEERYRTVLEEMEEAYFEADVHGNFTVINDATCHVLGYPREEIIGINYQAFVAKEHTDVVYQTFNQVYRTGTTIRQFQYEVLGKDGGTRFVEVSVSPMRDKGGQVVGFRGVGRDITERRKAEEALAKSEERYRSVLEQMEEAYFEVDIAGNFTFFNDETCRQLGYSREELMGMNYRDYTSEDDAQRVYETFNQVYRTGKPNTRFPVERIRKDGSRLSTETSGFPLRNESGEIIGFRGVAADVTERKRAEEALRLSEQNFRDSIESSPLGIHVIDKDGKHIYANRAFLNMWGYSSVEELQAVPRKQRYTPQGYKEHMERIKKRKRGEQAPLSYEVSIVRSDGQVRYLSASRGELLWSGERQFQVVYQDITERKQAEEQTKKLYYLQTAIRYINESLLKVDDEPALFEQVCHFLKDVEFIKFCWIGLTDKESLELKPVAYSGFEDGYLSSIKVSVSDSAYSRGPIGAAIKTRQPCTVADIENDPKFAPRREAALKRGYASSFSCSFNS